MVSEQEISAAIGGTAYGSDGGKLGTIEAFFADDRTGAPTWVSISTGLFGTRHSVVPVAGATFTDGALRIPVTADAVKSAPVMAGDHLDPADEEALRRHYGFAGTPPAETPPVAAPPSDTTASDTPVAPPPVAPPPAGAGRAGSGPPRNGGEEPRGGPQGPPPRPATGVSRRDLERIRPDFSCGAIV